MKKLFTTLTLAAAAVIAAAQVPAFPGAEGHGRYVTGGRGGKIVHVTNLNDSGTGSFRQAVSGNDKKIVVFDVGGVIPLAKDVNIGANTTILGQTAPAPGITLRYYNVNPNGNNIVMRYIRIRRGEEKNVNDGADASTARHFTGIMLDHCSFSWSIDETASFYDNNNFTMQWCTIGESLVHPGHSKGAHGYGGIWGGKLASFHHNLLIHHSNRTPRFNGARYNWTGYTGNLLYSQYQWENAVQAENVDFRNCVIYNCGNGCYGGPGGGKINMVNNYYKTGPAATTSQLTTVTVGAEGNAEGYPIYWTMTSRYYLSGNRINSTSNAGWNNMKYDNGTYVISGKRYSPDPNHYNGANETYVKNADGTDCICIQLDEPTETGVITTHSAVNAYNKVLQYSGASLIPDQVDTRYFTETKNGNATYKGSATSYEKDGKTYSCTPTYGRIDKVSDVNGYTEANFGTGHREAGFDTDNDGIPDAWETANGLNPNSAGDANLYTLDPKKMYTNIEIYANSLVQDIVINGNSDSDDAVKEYFPAYKKEDGTAVEAINANASDKEPEDQPQTEVKAEGAVSWMLGDGSDQPVASYSDALAPYMGGATVSMGSHLKVTGTKTAGEYTETAYTITDDKIDDGPNDANAVVFSITPAEGYLFQPSDISFIATRIGTDHGKFQAYWTVPSGATTMVATQQLAERNNATPPFTTVNETITGVAAAGGTSFLTINLFDIPSGKQMGLSNVIINGKVSSETSGISERLTITARPAATYNLSGQQVDSKYRGLIIEKGRKRLAK